MQKAEQKCQRDLAHCLEVDCITAIKQQHHTNWSKTFLPPINFPSNEKMSLIDLLPLTKRQYVHYLPKKTLEACQQCEELAKEMGIAAIGGESPCKRYTDFRILCIPQHLL